MANPAPFTCDVINDKGVTVLALKGKLDALATEELQVRIDKLRKEGHSRFVFDLAYLDYVGSFGLRIFVALHNDVQSEGGVCVCNTSANVRSIFSVTKLDKLLRSYPSRADAIDALRSR